VRRSSYLKYIFGWTAFAVAALFGDIFYDAAAFATPWNLPQAITDKNSKIQYRYVAHGTPTQGVLSGVSGKAWLSGGDSQLVRAELLIPIPKLSGALGELGESFGGLLDAVELPPAHLSITRLNGLCTPQQAELKGACRATAEGEAQFGGIKRSVSFPLTVSRGHGGYRLEGAGSFDPSQAQADSSAALLGMIERADLKFTIDLPDPR
jgi:hypothetical protein